MNYRHAFHAGNFADVVKHIVLTRVLVHLTKKPASFRLIDTHAGIGVYDLSSDEATRTGEWRDGIGRLTNNLPPEAVANLLTPYLDVVTELNGGAELRAYPGSPEIARRLSRRQDRITLTELHPLDAETLSALYRPDRRIKVVELDGWLALGSFVPPKERRGVVLVDPAFEEVDEYGRLADGLIKAHKRWPTGTYCLWYPIKDAAKTDRFAESVAHSGIRKVLRIEFATSTPSADGRLAACGLLIVNPPYTLHDEMCLIMPWLSDILTTGDGAGYQVDWLVAE